MIKLVLYFLLLPVVSGMMAVAFTEDTAVAWTAILIPLIIILFLVLLNGLYVSAEFSIIGVRRTQLEEMIEDGDKQAESVLDIVASRFQQDRYIATAQLGITLASLGLAMYGEPHIAHFLEPYLAQLWFEPSPELVETLGYVIALGLLTYLHVVLGEMVPKSLALADAPQTSLRLHQPMKISQTILHYPVQILNSIGRWLLRLFRIPPVEGHERVLSAEELELLVTESAEAKLLLAEEQEMIVNIFEFSDRTVEQVMTSRTRVEAIPQDIHREELLQFVTHSRHSRFPVYEGDLDHIVGVVHLKDIVRQTVKSQGKFDLRLITRSVPAVPEDLPVPNLLAAFKREHLHMAIVLDEFGGMAGIVTLEDLVEEIVGEVRDEFDVEKDPYEELEPGVIEAAGDYLVDDFEDGFWGNELLPDVETVGGLVVTKLGRPPEVNDEVKYNEDTISMRVLEVDGRAVSRVRIEFPDPEKENKEDH
ncbi:MAG: HlyC/CorC family transporter [Chloroflexi bacterium]|nr:HlyC/CorC family transporter [Chloroflexota bacterium]